MNSKNAGKVFYCYEQRADGIWCGFDSKPDKCYQKMDCCLEQLPFYHLSSGRILQKCLVWIRCLVQRGAISVIPGMSWFYCPFWAHGSKQGRLLGKVVVQVALV